MIDFPWRKRHFIVLFIYTVAAHLPRHTLRPVLLFCVYTHFSEIVTFFVDGGSIRFFVGFLSPAPSQNHVDRLTPFVEVIEMIRSRPPGSAAVMRCILNSICVSIRRVHEFNSLAKTFSVVAWFFGLLPRRNAMTSCLSRNSFCSSRFFQAFSFAGNTNVFLRTQISSFCYVSSRFFKIRLHLFHQALQNSQGRVFLSCFYIFFEVTVLEKKGKREKGEEGKKEMRWRFLERVGCVRFVEMRVVSPSCPPSYSNSFTQPRQKSRILEVGELHARRKAELDKRREKLSVHAACCAALRCW